MKSSIKFTIFIFIIFLFSGCVKNTPKATPTPTPEVSVETEMPPAEPTTAPKKELKLGYSIIIDHNGSQGSKHDDGVIKTNAVIFALTVSSDDVITDCRIDAVQTRIGFNNYGKITSDIKEGAETGKNASDTEWTMQAEAFEKYVCGKTLNEIKTSQTNNNETSESVAVFDDELIRGVEDALSRAKNAGTKINDKLGIGIVTSIEESKSADDSDTNGITKISSTYAILTADGSGKVTACILDGSQSNVEFNYTGNITSDINAEEKTKNMLGNEYGLKSVSGIGREWYEQANAFAEYISGKILSEIKGIAVSQNGAPKEQDLVSSVTINIGDFLEAVNKAFDNMK